MTSMRASNRITSNHIHPINLVIYLPDERCHLHHSVIIQLSGLFYSMQISNQKTPNNTIKLTKNMKSNEARERGMREQIYQCLWT